MTPEKIYPDEATLERGARACPMLAHCPDRTFSFCLKKWVDIDGELMFRKVTYKHCYDCRHDDNDVRDEA